MCQSPLLLNYWSIVDVVGCFRSVRNPERTGPSSCQRPNVPASRAHSVRKGARAHRPRAGHGGQVCGLAQVAGERVSPFLKPTQEELLGSRRLGLYMSVSL